MTDTTLSYCGAEVRSQDHDRFLTCLFAPSERREDLFALYAFNLEVAKTAEVVSEAMLGRIRLQWWRESLEGIYEGTPRKHAVVEPLEKAVSLHRLPRNLFDELIDGREQDLEEAPPKDLDALERYAALTSGNLSQLAALVLGLEDERSLQSAGHIGTAWALVGLLRAIPFHATHKRSFLPESLVTEHGLVRSELFELRKSDALQAITRKIAQRAQWHLKEARRQGGAFQRRSLAAVLPATIAKRHLKSLAKADWNPLDPAALGSDHGLALLLLLAYLRGSA